MDELFRLEVEDVFTLTGRGTAVMGPILSGELRVGDELRIEGRGTVAAVCTAIDGASRAKRTLEDGVPRVGLIVPAWSKQDLVVGDVLVQVRRE